jgi:outer membrane receptor protein involved in Fe transport
MMEHDVADLVRERGGAINVRIRLSGDTVQALLPELRTLLSREDALRGRVSVEQPTIPSGQMGGLAEVLIVALGAQGAGTALATSLAAWIRHRRPSVDIEVTGADGRRVRIAARDADIDVAALVREVVGDREEGGTAATGRDPVAAPEPPDQIGRGRGDAPA